MPRFLSLDVCPYGKGAQVFVRDGHGEFIRPSPFAKFCPDHNAVIENVRAFLEWEYALPSTYKGEKDEG